MKRLILFFLSATLLSPTVLADRKTAVVGEYNGYDVTEEEVMRQFKSIIQTQSENKGKTFFQLDKKLQELLVRSYINQKLFEQEANKLGIKKSETFKNKLKMAESQMLQQELIERYLQNTLTQQMIDEEYNALIKNLTGQREIKVSHILVDTEEKSKEIKKKLNKGSKFEDLAKDLSKDEGSRINNGELGYVLKGQLVPEFESKAFSMKKGEISEPTKTQFGWHIIKVIDSRIVEIPTKEQAENGIKGKLSREAIEKYFTQLASDANVKVKLNY